MTFFWCIIIYIIGCVVAYMAIAFYNDFYEEDIKIGSIFLSWLMVAVFMLIVFFNMIRPFWEITPSFKKKEKEADSDINENHEKEN